MSVAPRRSSRSAGTAPVTDMAAAQFQFDDYDLDRIAGQAAAFGQERFGYLVTPNTDHLIRLDEDAEFRALYADASFVLLDSQFIAHWVRLLRGLRLPVCAGSDLTARLFDKVIRPGDPLVLIGASEEQRRCLEARYGLRRLAHFNPPMGFIRDPAAVEQCLQFVEQHSPFRFCLLAVGSPQQEILAQRLLQRNRARGLALCVGASIDFLTGVEVRAPVWMRRAGLEWLFRLSQSPRRLARRYLIRGPRIFGLLRRARIELRPAKVATDHPV
jgi:exopolysaccharide biosynthesis WecB/TagA/CpsF family protein